MTPSELESWRQFYIAFPFDDYHRHYRPAAMVAASLSGGDLTRRLDWLQPRQSVGNYSQADVRTLAAFGVQPNRG